MSNPNGFRVWVNDENPSGDNFNNYLQEQVVALFDDTTDRDTQIPSPNIDGLRCYVRDTGIEYVLVSDGDLVSPVFEWVEVSRTKAWGTYTPTLTVPVGGTDPTLGTGAVQVGRWHKEGTLVTVAIYLAFGSSGIAAGSGIYEISLPTECPVSPEWFGAQELIAGNGVAIDDDVGTRRTLAVTTVAEDKIRLEADGLTGPVTESNLLTWAASDVVLSGVITYECKEVHT